jgi:hypothetical protein
MDKEEALSAILHSVLEEPNLVNDSEWDAFAMLVVLKPDVSEMTAFRYRRSEPGKPTPLRATRFNLFRNLQAATTAPDGTSWQACIVRIERDSRRYSVDFFHGDDADQWQITPAGYARIAQAIRPG